MASPASFRSCTAATAPPPAGRLEGVRRVDDLAGPRHVRHLGELAPLEVAHDRDPHGRGACHGRRASVPRRWRIRCASGATPRSRSPRSSCARAARRVPAASTRTSRPRASRRSSTCAPRGSLSEEQRERIAARLGPVVRAVAQDTRSQARNRELARRAPARPARGRAGGAAPAAGDEAHGGVAPAARRVEAAPRRGEAAAPATRALSFRGGYSPGGAAAPPPSPSGGGGGSARRLARAAARRPRAGPARPAWPWSPPVPPVAGGVVGATGVAVASRPRSPCWSCPVGRESRRR